MLFACAVLFLLLLNTACSAQKSGSKFEAHPEKETLSAENKGAVETQGESGKVQIDYLTPVAMIRNPEIFVYKEKRRLYVMQSNVLVRDYPIALGLNPAGDKEKLGDGKTPEGDFVICGKEPMGRFPKALALNYPSRKHVERAYFLGILSSAQFKEILKSYEKGQAPTVNTSVGERIAIHGGGAHLDWTNGCIALYDSDLEELFRIATVGTKVSIRP
ncbi:MAG: L,D-transpeptidase [Deltaproteobacteria bacterium]|nr:L,D-transpeptidase [Deltaproteobacteria bacterium]